jgi:peroxiredoxin
MVVSRFFPWVILAAFAVVTLAMWATIPLTSGEGLQREKPNTPGHVSGPETHYVTPRQLADSNALYSRSIDVFDTIGLDGRSMTWSDLSGGQPLVLVFIKKGCPCSVRFEGHLQQVERLYRGAVRFAGVIDASAEEAQRYATQLQVSHPILADPQRRIIRHFQVMNGGYAVLLTPDREIAGFWPGWCADTFRDLGKRISELAGRKECPLDVSGMPGALTTGCPFEL